MQGKEDTTITFNNDDTITIKKDDLSIKLSIKDLFGNQTLLESLSHGQFNNIRQIINQHIAQLPVEFITLIDKITAKKNIVEGDINNVTNLRIGDDIHHHYNRSNIERSRFIIKRGEELEAYDLLGLRAKKSKGYNDSYYLKRGDVDTLLNRYLDTDKHIILTGKPLTGKSRALFEVLRNKYSDNLVFMPLNNGTIDYSDFKNDLDLKDKIFIVFNDYEDYFSDQKFKILIRELLSKKKTNVQIIITCNNYYYHELCRILDNLIQGFVTLRIGDLNNSQRKELQDKFGRVDNSFLSERIGTYFLDVDEMRHIYTNQLNKLQKAILRSYKVLRCWKRNNRSVSEIIRTHTVYYLNENFISDELWDDALNKLQDSGFVTLCNEKPLDPVRLLIDKSYEEKIIGFEGEKDILPEDKQVKEILQYYPKTTEKYNKLIMRVHNDKLAWNVFYQMEKDKVSRNFLTFFALHDRFKIIDTERPEEQPEPHPQVLSNIKFADPTTKINWDLFRIKGSIKDYVSYIEKIPSNIIADEFTLYACNLNLQTFSECWLCYQTLKSKYPLNRIEWKYNILSAYDHYSLDNISFKEIWELFYPEVKDIIQNSDVRGWIFHFIQFFKNAPDFKWATLVYEEMAISDKEVQTTLFTKYLNKAITHEQVWEVYEKANTLFRRWGKEIKINFYNTMLLHKSILNQEEIHFIYSRIKQPDSFTFLVLFNKESLSIEKVFEYFNECIKMVDDGKIPTSHFQASQHFAALLTRNFDTNKLRLIFKKSLEFDKTPGYFYSQNYRGKKIIKDSQLEDFTNIFMEEVDNGTLSVTKLNSSLYLKILYRNLSLPQMIDVYKHATKHGIKLNNLSFNRILERANSLDELIYLKSCVEFNNTYSKVSLIKNMIVKSNDTDDFKKSIHCIHELSINFEDDVTKNHFDTFLSKRFLLKSKKITQVSECIEILNLLLENRIKLSNIVYEYLIGRAISENNYNHVVILLKLMKSADFILPKSTKIGIQKMYIRRLRNNSFTFKEISDEIIVLRGFIPLLCEFSSDKLFFYLILFSYLVKKTNEFDNLFSFLIYMQEDNVQYTAKIQKNIIDPLSKLVKTPLQRKQFEHFIHVLRYSKFIKK